MVGKAVIPIAGLGTRLLPVSRVVPKAMLPLMGADGRLRTVLHVICAEARAAGAGEVGVVVSPGQREVCEAYFEAARQAGADDLPERIEYILQETPAGFGDAVAAAAAFVGTDEDFLVMLGDHVYRADPGEASCAAQVVGAAQRHRGAAMIGVQTVCEDELSRVGVASGTPMENGVYRCDRFVEKPTLDQARARLATEDLPSGQYLAHAGIYCFSREIFDCIAELTKRDQAGEIELADAQSLLLRRHPEDYYLYRIAGRAWDTGSPEGYARTFAAMGPAG
jgi:UTP--glucose-1-phosphate uridylyltransferase